jgi:hypothetical protein
MVDERILLGARFYIEKRNVRDILEKAGHLKVVPAIFAGCREFDILDIPSWALNVEPLH